MSTEGWKPCPWCGYFTKYPEMVLCPRCEDVLRRAGVQHRTLEEAQAAGKNICEAEGTGTK